MNAVNLRKSVGECGAKKLSSCSGGITKIHCFEKKMFKLRKIISECDKIT